MFEFLRPCNKNSEKTNFKATHCLTVKKCPKSKTVRAVVALYYDKPVQKKHYGNWSHFSYETKCEEQVFESVKELEVYIKRVQILLEALHDTKFAMKAEE